MTSSDLTGLGEDPDDAFGGPAVPQMRRPALPEWLLERAERLVHDPTGIAADDPVGAVRDRDRTLRAVAKGQAGDPEEGRFFLDAPGIGEHQPRAAHEGDEVEVPERVEERDALTVERLSRTQLAAAKVCLPEELLLDARVEGKDDRDVPGQRL